MKILITAGPTREPIDAVRFISNRSSGRMGLALASAAAEAGHDVTLLLGPGPDDSASPPGCRVMRFESTADLKRLLDDQWSKHQVLIMAAAVADFRPSTVFDGKLSRDTSKPLTLNLEPTSDLVAHMAATRRPNQRVVAFALEEPEALQRRATEKLRRKNVDAIVANDLTSFEASHARAIWITADKVEQSPGRISKLELARWILSLIDRDL